MGRRSVGMATGYLASHLMLHFGPIQALGVHGRRLVITTKDDRSVITVCAGTRAGKQRPTRTVSSRYVSHFDRFIAPRVGDRCLVQL